MKRKLGRLLVPTILVIWIALRFDLGEALKRIASIDPMFFGLALIAFSVMLAVRAWRWLIVVRLLGIDTPTAVVVRSFALGFAGSALLGEGLGSLGRLYDMRLAGADAKTTGFAVVFDKAYDVLVLVALAPVAAIVLPSDTTRPTPATITLLVLAVLGLAILALSPAGMRTLGRLLARLFPRRPKLAGLGSLGDRMGPRHHTAVAALSLGARFAQFTFVWLLALGLDIPISLLEMSAIMTFVGAVVFLPISISGLGIRDLSMIGLFALIGYPSASALSLSVAVFAVTVTARLVVGIAWASLRSTSSVDTHL